MRCDRHQEKKANLSIPAKVNRIWIAGCLLLSVISLAARSDRDSRVIVAVFDAGFEGIDQLSTDRVLRKEHTARDPVKDEVCDMDRRYNGTGAYEKT